MSALSLESVIHDLYEWRRDKLALTVLVGTLGGDSTTEAWVRLDDVLDTMRTLERDSRKNRGRSKQPRLEIDHDIAARVLSLAEEVEPWLRQLAERDDG